MFVQERSSWIVSEIVFSFQKVLRKCIVIFEDRHPNDVKLETVDKMYMFQFQKLQQGTASTTDD